MNTINCNDEKIETLEYEALNCNVIGVKEILAQGIEIGSIPLTKFFEFNSSGCTEKIDAKTEILHILIQYGIDVTLDESETLSYAIFYECYEFANIILDAGAEVRSPYGQLGLNYAINHGNFDLTIKMLEFGADITDEDILSAAIYHPKILRYLLEMGGGIIYQEDVNQALVDAIKARQTYSIRELLTHGADPNWENGLANRLALESRNSVIISLLLNY